MSMSRNTIHSVLTKEEDLQFVRQGWGIDLNVPDEDEEIADDHKDDLPAGHEAGHGDVLEVSNNDGDAAAEHCADNQQDARHQEHVLVAIRALNLKLCIDI